MGSTKSWSSQRSSASSLSRWSAGCPRFILSPLEDQSASVVEEHFFHGIRVDARFLDSCSLFHKPLLLLITGEWCFRCWLYLFDTYVVVRGFGPCYKSTVREQVDIRSLSATELAVEFDGWSVFGIHCVIPRTADDFILAFFVLVASSDVVCHVVHLRYAPVAVPWDISLLGSCCAAHSGGPLKILIVRWHR